MFVCSNGSKISYSLVNDLVVDCPSDPSDQFLYLNLLWNNTYQSCTDPDEIPCIVGHPKCYHLRHVCIYRINNMHHMTPCRTGSHLQTCKRFTCNGHFKCPQFYCIPWGYVCNGKWDCPLGLDETQQVCAGRKCPGMFKCKDSKLCLHLEDICDENTDCPRKDDEIMCNLNGNICPTSCYCLNYALFCAEMHFQLQQAIDKPYLSIHLFLCNLTSVIFTQHSHALNISHNFVSNLQVKCNPCSLVMLDLSFNKLWKLYQGSFVNMPLIKFIVLKNNQIYLVEKNAFANAINLFLVDLSFNKIAKLSELHFRNIYKLQLLNILRNPVTSLNKISKDTNTSFNVIVTSNYQVCCFKPEGTLCINKDRPEDVSCLKLLPTDPIQICTVILDLSVLFLNLLAVFVTMTRFHHQAKKKTKKHAFFIIAASVVLGQLVLGFYLAILWIADLHYEHNFPLYKTEWRASLWCAMIYFLSLFYDIFMPFIALLFAIARLWLVIKPFDQRFISVRLVSKLILCCVSMSLMLTGIFLSVHLVYNSVQHPMCSLILDNILVSIFIICLQLTAVFVVVCSHFMLTIHFKKSKIASGQSSALGIATYFQLICLTTSYILEWIPASVVYLVATALPGYPSRLVVWMAVFGRPWTSLTTTAIFVIIICRH